MLNQHFCANVTEKRGMGENRSEEWRDRSCRSLPASTGGLPVTIRMWKLLYFQL